MNPLVSVVIPVYNVEKYVKQCIDSITRQTYSNLEIIIVDDGSTDKSMDALKDISDSRVIIIHQSNQGLSSARNAGIECSNGEYIAFIDSDDFVSDKFIEILVHFCDLYNADIACCESLDFIDGYDNNALNIINDKKTNDIKAYVYSSDEAIIRSFYQKPSITGAVLKLYKRQLFDDITFPIGRYLEDFATTYKFFQKSNRVVYLESKMYAYRFRKGSIMNKASDKRISDGLWIAERIEEAFIDSGEDLKKSVSCAVFRVNRIAFSQIDKTNECYDLVWDNVKKYRKEVLYNCKASVHDRLLALASFAGRGAFRTAISLFGWVRFKKNSVLLRG